MSTLLHKPDKPRKPLGRLLNLKQIVPFAFLLFLSWGAPLIGPELISETKFPERDCRSGTDILEAETSSFFATQDSKNLALTGQPVSSLKSGFTFIPGTTF